MGTIDTQAYTIRWGNANRTVLIVRPKRLISWDEYREGTHKMHQLIQRTPHTVHVIYHVERLHPLPPGNATAQFSRSLADQPDNMGIQVIVGTSPILMTTVQVFLFAAGQFLDPLVHFADSLKDAHALIERTNGGQRASNGV